MTNFKVAASIVSVSVLLAFPAQSEGEMPNSYLDTVAAKLIMAGFHDIEVVDEKTNKLHAYDEWGSEVIIVIDDTNRKVLSTDYVHPADD